MSVGSDISFEQSFEEVYYKDSVSSWLLSDGGTLLPLYLSIASFIRTAQHVFRTGQ